MAAKLKSISRQIHWSLLLRAAILALGWFFLPFWLFFLLALYLYFIPFFNSRRLFWPFFALLTLAYLEPAQGSAAIGYFLIFGALFYYLLLIKDLFLIDRGTAYEILILALSFFLIRDFYVRLGTELFSAASIWYGLLVAILIGLLAGSWIAYMAKDIGTRRRSVAWLIFLLLWQFLLLGLFLPVDFIYQSTVIFIATALILDLVPRNVLVGQL